MLKYSGILFIREFFIQMRAANLPPSSLPTFLEKRKRQNKIDHSHLNETLSLEKKTTVLFISKDSILDYFYATLSNVMRYEMNIFYRFFIEKFCAIIEDTHILIYSKIQ